MKKVKILWCLVLMVFSIVLFAGTVGYDQLEYRTVTLNNKTMPYRLFVPPVYNSQNKYPIIIFLHGAGEKGSDNEKQLKNYGQGSMYFINTEFHAAYPTFYMAPQTTGGWNQDYLAMVQKAIAELSKEFNIDYERIYLTGISLGGSGIFNFMTWAPDYFAAGIPMSFGSGDAEKLLNQNIWTFHAANDTVVGIGGTDGIVRAIRSLGGSIIYTRYDSGGHGIWSASYKNPLLIHWLMAQRKGQKNNIAPILRINSPSNNNYIVYPDELINLSGNFQFGGYSIYSVTWKNSRGGSGNCNVSGENWSVNNLQLFRGDNNLIEILVTGDSMVSSYGGNTTYNTTVRLNFEVSTEKKVAIDVYKKIDGTTVSDLINSSSFPDSPDQTDFWNNTDAKKFGGLKFGQRMRTLVIPPVSGEYRFYVAADDSAEVYLSTDSDPKNKVKICSHSGYLSNPYEYTRYPAQQSAPIFMEKGKEYYLEVLHKQQWGSDFLSVAWKIPGVDSINVISSQYLKNISGNNPGTVNQPPVVNAGNDQIITLPEEAYLSAEASDDGLVNSSLTFQWTLESGPGTVTFSEPQKNITTATFTMPGQYKIRITVNDGELSAYDEINITVNPMPIVKYSLTVNNGSGSGVYEAGTTVHIEAALASTGQEFDKWTGDVSNIADIFSAKTDVIMPNSNVTLSATYKNITPPNQAPIVNIGSDITLQLPQNTATLNATVIDDGLPSGVLSMTWQVENGPGSVIFSAPSSTNTNATFQKEGDYLIKLTVSDGILSGSDTLLVKVLPQITNNRKIFIDFGRNTKLSQQYWNNVTAVTEGTNVELIDSEGILTGMRFTITDSFSGINTSGTTSENSLSLPVSATCDSFWGNDITYASQLEPSAAFKIEGLEVDKKYKLTFYASRMNVSDNRETQYNIYGASNITTYLNPANNINNSVSESIKPNADGEIEVQIQKGPNNNNYYGFYYIGAIIIEEEENQLPAEGQVLKLSFDENSGETVYDDGPMQLDGIIQNQVSRIVGIQNNGLSFNGNGQVIISGANNINFQNLTIAFWFKPLTYDGTFQTLFAKSNSVIEIRPYGTKILNFRLDWGGDYAENLTCPVPSLNQWHHFAGTYDGQSIKIYIDGVLMAQKAENRPVKNYSSTMTIGARYGKTFYTGSIDEFFIYDRALSEREILQLIQY